MVSSLEIWVKSEDPSYEVSNLGRVKSIPRVVVSGPKTGNGVRFIKGGVLTPFVVKSTGYLQVSLSMKKRISVHRLVAKAFCSGYYDGAVVNHINGIRSDNRADNLEWVSHSENNMHSYRYLGMKSRLTGRLGKESNKHYPVIATPASGGESIRFDSGMDAIRSGFATDSGGLSRCCHGKSKTHNGYTWKFENSEEVK